MEGTAMSGTCKQTERDLDGAEASPCSSALHAIPGFDQVSIKKFYSKGSTLFAEGQTARGVYVLCEGRVKLSITSAEGKQLIVRIARPGDMLGLHATLAGHSYEGTAVTFAPCRVDFVTGKDLLDLLNRQESSGLGLAIAVSKEFAEFVEQARVLLLSVSAAEKLAGLLLTWGDAFGKPAPFGIHLHTLLTHEELGQMIGASRETVTRALNALKRRQVIRATNGDLWIRNRAALAAVAKMR
jgi:CRP/FNR family transcriptional regulator, cyclic AMP receptor protein